MILKEALNQLIFTHQVVAGVFLFGSGLSLRQHDRTL